MKNVQIVKKAIQTIKSNIETMKSYKRFWRC